MKLIVSGSLGFSKYPNLHGKRMSANPVAATTALGRYEEEFERVKAEILSLQEKRGQILTVCTMGRDGIEESADKWALSTKVKVERFKPLWLKNGVRDNMAGYGKTLEMVNFADSGLFIFSGEPDTQCKITMNELDKARKPYRKVIL